MLTSNKNLILAFLTVLLFAFALNTLNVSCIRNQTNKDNQPSNSTLVFNQTILSIDNSWYLPQIKNFLAEKGFTCDTSDIKMSVRRTPVYPMFYGIHYILFGEEKSFFVIKITQTFLFALSSIALLLAVFFLTGNKKIAWFSFLLYGFNPTLISYTYYTITESLSPALICFLLYFLAKSIKSNAARDWFFTGILFSMASLCRPLIFIYGGSVAFILFYIYRKDFRKMTISVVAFGFAVCLIFIPYVIRNYKVTGGDIVLLEKYYNDPMGYGMQNIELRKWIASWMNPADYSSERISNAMIKSVRFNHSKKELIDSLTRTIPSRVYSSYNKETVLEIYESVYGYYAYKFNPGENKNIDSAETKAVQNIRMHKEKFIQNNPIKYFIITPLIFIKSIIVQSNSGTIACLDNYQNNKKAYLIKIILVLLNIYLFISLAGNLFFLKKYFVIYISSLFFISANIGYMVFIINYIEVRYLVPLFPFLYLSGAIFAFEIFELLKKKRLHF